MNEWEKGKTTLLKGQVCVIPPCKTHYILQGENSKHIGFRFRVVNDKSDNGKNKLFGDEVIIKDSNIYEKYLKAAAQNHENNYPDFMVSELLILSIYELSDKRLDELKKEYNENFLKNSDSDILVSEKIEDFLNRNYTQNVHLDDLAAYLNLGRRQTQRMCMKYFGENFSGLLNRKRLVMSKYLLKNTDYSVEEISRKAGFENINYFYRKFSVSHSVTPGEYRKNN